ncbi:hypothetical protein BH23THE1_BH23THE1_32910 [soil metagenome]
MSEIPLPTTLDANISYDIGSIVGVRNLFEDCTLEENRAIDDVLKLATKSCGEATKTLQSTISFVLMAVISCAKTGFIGMGAQNTLILLRLSATTRDEKIVHNVILRVLKKYSAVLNCIAIQNECAGMKNELDTLQRTQSPTEANKKLYAQIAAKHNERLEHFEKLRGTIPREAFRIINQADMSDLELVDAKDVVRVDKNIIYTSAPPNYYFKK